MKGIGYWYNEYKSSTSFGLILGLLVTLSCVLSRDIPAEVYYAFIAPLQTSCLVAISTFGAWELFRHHENMRVRKLTGTMLLVWAGLLFILLIRITFPYDHSYSTPAPSERLRCIEMIVGDLFAWMLMLYPTELLRPNWMNLKRALIQIAPIFVFGAIDFMVPWDLRWLLGLYPVLLLSILYMHAHAYRVWCEENYSSMKDIDVQWIVEYLTMVFISGGSFYYMCFSDSPTRAFTQQWLLFFILAYSTEQILFRPDPWKAMDERVNEPAEEEEKIPSEEPVSENPEENFKNDHVYREILERWMETEKPYRNADLRLDDLKARLPLNKTYLSQMINREFGCNFYHLITRYRIEEAKRMIRENPAMQLKEISDYCGFSSPTVFGRMFTRETGLTPRDWSLKNRLSFN